MTLVKTPSISLTYNGKNITRSVEQDLIELSYLDRTEVESDELEFTVTDTDNKWSNLWRPDPGATLTLALGYSGDLTPVGVFEVDELNFMYNGNGRGLRVRALSAIVSKDLRTKRDWTYRDITLINLAKTIGSRMKLTVSGKIDNIYFTEVVQYQETDLAFMRRIAKTYGYIFSVKNKKLVFTKLTLLEKQATVLQLGPDKLADINISDVTGRTFREAKQKYYDPAKKRNITIKKPGGTYGSDIDEMEGHAENDQQAEAQAEARATQIRQGQVKGSIELTEGTPFIVAGNNITLVRIGKFSGTYNIEASTHVISKRGGYVTYADVFKVGDISETLY